MVHVKIPSPKKRLTTSLFENIYTGLKIKKTDLEICIIELPAYNGYFFE